MENRISPKVPLLLHFCDTNDSDLDNMMEDATTSGSDTCSPSRDSPSSYYAIYTVPHRHHNQHHATHSNNNNNGGSGTTSVNGRRPRTTSVNIELGTGQNGLFPTDINTRRSADAARRTGLHHRTSHSISPSRRTADGMTSLSVDEPADTTFSAVDGLQPDFRPRSKSGSKAIRDWFARSSPARTVASGGSGGHPAPSTAEPASTAGAASEQVGCGGNQQKTTSTSADAGPPADFRSRTGSKGLKDLLRIKSRRHASGSAAVGGNGSGLETKETSDVVRWSPRGGAAAAGGNGQVTPRRSPVDAAASPIASVSQTGSIGSTGSGSGPASAGSASAGGGLSRVKVFWGAFRHRTHSDSLTTECHNDESTTSGSTESDDRPQQLLSASYSVGPADFVEMYRARAVSDPRPEYRLSVLTRVRMQKLCRETTDSLRHQQLVVWKDKVAGDKIFTLPNPSCINQQTSGVNNSSVADTAGRLMCTATPMTCRRLLETVTCYDVMPYNAKMVIFDSQLAVRKALFALLDNCVRSAAVWDSNRQTITGMLTVTDFIAILHHYYELTRSELDDLGEQTISSWRVILNSDERPLVYVQPECSLLDVFHSLRDATVHRLLVIDHRAGNVVHAMTHFQLLQHVYAHLENSELCELERTLEDLGLGLKTDVATVTDKTPIIDALRLFLNRHVSALPVVDSVTSQLQDVYCKSDVISLAIKSTYSNLDITVGEALQTASDQRFESLQTCLNSDSLKSVINKLVSTQVHQLVIVDSTGCVDGVVTHSDIMEYLVNCGAPSS